jgi:ATP-dependent DNA helicase RecG
VAKLSGSARINEALSKYDILTFNDVIFHLPSRYLDLRYSEEFKLNTNEKVVLFLKATSAPVIIKTPRVTIIRFSAISANNVPYHIVAYNQRYILNMVNVGTELTVYGTINLKKQEISLIKLFPRQLSSAEQVSPLYSLPSEVANHEFVKIVQKALKNIDVQSEIPPAIRSKNDLVPLNTALMHVHRPLSFDEVFIGLKALKYEEGLAYFLKMLLIKRTNSVLVNDHKTIVDLKLANDFVRALPFTLTKEQLEAVREIGYDMNKQTLMYRLLQGDVGSGKTVVAFIALYINYLRNAQGVFLAPTESLAKQHYESMLAFFKPFNVRIKLLIGALKESEKAELKAQIQLGNVDIVVGTHALFSEDVIYPKLELVIIDEQHKFGVNQRETLLNKGDKADLLLLSATPIPQTLASVIYSDTDITTIKSFPHAGRQVISEVAAYKTKELVKEIENALKENRQVYIIAPKITYGKKTNVLELYDTYKKHFPSEVTLLHGQMTSEEKDESLALFKAGIKPILIATSVVEVGIDVKNAGLMIIYEPQSFGLSSLHQLRGRIGRDGKTAKLLLVSEEEDNLKLYEFAKEDDGFKIAELDLKLRGPGELIGERQSGMPSFLYLNVVKDIALIQNIKRDALEIINNPHVEEYRLYLKKIQDSIS